MMNEEPKCPDCGNELHKVIQDSNSPLNSDQFDSVKAGDWYCEKCPSNERGRTNFRYFWQRELNTPNDPPDSVGAASQWEPSEQEVDPVTVAWWNEFRSKRPVLTPHGAIQFAAHKHLIACHQREEALRREIELLAKKYAETHQCLLNREESLKREGERWVKAKTELDTATREIERLKAQLEPPPQMEKPK